MRRRKIKGALESYRGFKEYALPEDECLKLEMDSLFDRYTSFRGLEIGCGRGDFLLGMARQNPDAVFVGVEMKEELLMRSAQKLASAEIKNVRLLLSDFSLCWGQLPFNAFDAIYLNFSDPWPKDRHAKRRLTHERYLAVYKNLLKPGGRLIVKTDNRPLFTFSCDSLLANGYAMIEVCDDLAALEDPHNVPTEYESKFMGLGHPIYRIVAVQQV